MSDLSRTAAAPAAGAAEPRLVETLRRRYRAELSREGSPALPFELRLPDRTRWRIGEEGEPAFTVTAVTEEGLRALDSFDELAIAEAYMAGDLDLDGDMLAVLKARPVLGDRHPLRYLWSTYVQPWLFGQVAGDKRWIRSHYDVEADFYLLWLDRRLRGYSHGFFERDDEPLEDGIERKFRYAFAACGIRPGDRVLDIGGGWGSFLQFAGEQGARVTSLTISEASERFMNELIAERGLQGCSVVREHLLEYRPRERFDAIVNLGVSEHLPDYRRVLAQYERLLEPGRRVYLDALSGGKHGFSTFITKWIYEGNTSPLCLPDYLEEMARTSFELVVAKNDRHSYFLTCKKWAENLEAHRDEVVARWSKQLYRRFQLYLWAAANSFETGLLSAHHLILQLPVADGGRRAEREAW